MEGTISHLRWHRQRLSSTLTILTNHFLSGGKWSRTRRRCGTNPLEFLECLAAPFEFGRGGNVLLQQAHHLCRDGFSMRASALPKGLVKVVRNVFDIQRCHWITPRFPLDYPRYILAITLGKGGYDASRLGQVFGIFGKRSLTPNLHTN